MELNKFNKTSKLNKSNKLKFSVGGNLAKSLLKTAKQAVEEKVFKPVLKEYGSNTEMFTDFLKQAKEQDITPDRNSKLYKQIVDELPGAKEYYKNTDSKTLQESATKLNKQGFQAEVGKDKHGREDLIIRLPNTEGKVRLTQNYEPNEFTTHKGDLLHLPKEDRIKLLAAQAHSLPLNSKIVNHGKSTIAGIRSRLNLGKHGFDVDLQGNHIQAIKDSESLEDIQKLAKDYNLEVLKNDTDKVLSGDVQPGQYYFKGITVTPKPLTDEQLADGLYLSTKTEQAQKGLKDSKVKDLVYHGSPVTNITEFRQHSGAIGEGTYTTNIKEIAKNFAPPAGDVYPLLVNSKKVIDVENMEELSDYIAEKQNLYDIDKVEDYIDLVYKIQDKKNKADVLKSSYAGKDEYQYAVKQPNQLKSLFREHLGKWDWNNPNIHKAVIPLGIGATGLGATEMKNGSKLKTKRLKTKYK